MTDVLPVIRQNDQVAANHQDTPREDFFEMLLHEAQGIMKSTGVERADYQLGGAQSESNNQLVARNVVPEMAISNSAMDPYSFSGDPGINQDTQPVDKNSQQRDAGGQANANDNMPQFDASAAGDMGGQQLGNQNIIPQFDPYSFGGDTTSGQPNGNQNMPQDDPYSYGGDTPNRKPSQPNPPQDNPPQPNPSPENPQQPVPSADNPSPNSPKPDVPPAAGDQKTKMGDRMFTVHPDGSAEYTVAHGDCVWFVATDVLKARNGQAPNDAQIVAEVSAIAKASGLTQHGRNPDLIYPGDKLVIPSAAKLNDDGAEPQT